MGHLARAVCAGHDDGDAVIVKEHATGLAK